MTYNSHTALVKLRTKIASLTSMVYYRGRQDQLGNRSTTRTLTIRPEEAIEALVEAAISWREESVKAALKRAYGPRCAEFKRECPCCDAWMAVDNLLEELGEES